MARGHWLIISVISSLSSIASLIVALLTNEWYVVLSYSNSFRVSLTESCTPELGCGSVNYAMLASYTNGTCDRPAGTIEGRNQATAGLVLAAVALAAIQSIVGGLVLGVGIWHIAWKIIHLLISVLAFCASLLVILIYGVTWEKWLFCDQSYCDFAANAYQDCASYFGYSFVAACCSAGILGVALMAASVAGCQKWVGEEPVPLSPVIFDPPTEVAETKVEEEPFPTPKAEEMPVQGKRKRYPNEPPLPPELEDGDWEYDPENGYFWSEERSLFFEPVTAQFFDPQSNAWYNPESGLWYKPLEESKYDVLRPQGEK